MILSKEDRKKYTVIIASSVISGVIAKYLTDYISQKSGLSSIGDWLLFLALFLISIYFALWFINIIASRWVGQELDTTL